jgi:hypothetical protein
MNDALMQRVEKKLDMLLQKNNISLCPTHTEELMAVFKPLPVEKDKIKWAHRLYRCPICASEHGIAEDDNYDPETMKTIDRD